MIDHAGLASVDSFDIKELLNVFRSLSVMLNKCCTFDYNILLDIAQLISHLSSNISSVIYVFVMKRDFLQISVNLVEFSLIR